MKLNNNQIKNKTNNILIIEDIKHVNNSGYGNPNYKINVLLDDETFLLNTIDDHAMNYKITSQMIGKSFNIEYVEVNGKYYILKI